MRVTERILTAVVVAVMAGLVVVPISQVVMRGVFTLPFIGAEELTRFLLICLVFLAYPLVVENGENIVMGELKAALPRPLRAAVNLAISVSAVVLCGFLAYVTAANILRNLMNATPTLGIPFVIFLGATLFGFASWARLLHRYPTALVMPFALLIPVSGIASGVLFLGESLAPMQALGAALVFAGLVVNVYGPRLRRARRRSTSSAASTSRSGRSSDSTSPASRAGTDS